MCYEKTIDLFEPKFVQLFNKSGVMKITDEPQKYTIVFHTIFTEPGFNVGIVRSNAYIHGNVYVVETDNPSNVIAEISVKNAPGRDVLGLDFATGPRISEAYAIAGKKLPAFIVKMSKK